MCFHGDIVEYFQTFPMYDTDVIIFKAGPLKQLALVNIIKH